MAQERILALQEQLSDEIRALPIGPARSSDHAAWLNAAYQCSKVALGTQRAQPGSSRAKARALCARIIDGETVPIDELRRVTTPKSMRDLERKLSPQHATKKTARQLDVEIAHALAKRTKKPSPEVAALFEHLVDIAEAEGMENLSLAKRDEGYVGDPKEFRFSEIFARRLPTYKYERLIDRIEECQRHVPGMGDSHFSLRRTLTEKEADWMRQEAKKIYDDERSHIERALRERS